MHKEQFLHMTEAMLETLRKVSSSGGKHPAMELRLKRDSIRWILSRCSYLVVKGLARWTGERIGEWPGKYLEITENGRKVLEKATRAASVYSKELTPKQREKLAQALSQSIRERLARKEFEEYFEFQSDTPVSVIKRALEICYGPQWYELIRRNWLSLFGDPPALCLRDPEKKWK